MTSNILIKISALVLGVFIVFVVVSKVGGGAENTTEIPSIGGESLSQEELLKMGIEADTPDDTVRTLVQKVKKSNQEMQDLKSSNENLRKDNSKLQDMEQSIFSKLRNELTSHSDEIQRNNRNEQNNNRTEMRSILDSMGSRFDELKSNYDQSSPVSLNQGASFPDDEIIWLSPTGEIVQNSIGGGDFPFDTGTSADTDAFEKKVSEEIPAYTIAKNSTLIDSTVMTALIGRVPIGENIIDPYSFKVIVGKKNLIANGKEVPELAYAIASGKATGDWTLSCISGDVHSITFVFEDGRIRTLPKPREISTGSQVRIREIKIGELSDDFGNPCVVGTKISNAAKYLGGRIAAQAAAAAAQGAAAAETTRSVNNFGGSVGGTSVVTGSTSEFILGKTLSGAANETAQWLKERQALNFDVVYADPGAKVAIHITQELKIDYEVDGRLTRHAGFSLGGIYRELD